MKENWMIRKVNNKGDMMSNDDIILIEYIKYNHYSLISAYHQNYIIYNQRQNVDEMKRKIIEEKDHVQLMLNRVLF